MGFQLFLSEPDRDGPLAQPGVNARAIGNGAVVFPGGVFVGHRDRVDRLAPVRAAGQAHHRLVGLDDAPRGMGDEIERVLQRRRGGGCQRRLGELAQLGRAACQRGFAAFLLGDVAHLDDRADCLALDVDHRARGEGDRIEAAVGRHEQLLALHLRASGKSAIDRALLERIMRTVGSGVVHDIVQRAPGHFGKGIARQLFGGRVGKHALLLVIHQKHRHGGVVEDCIQPPCGVGELLFGDMRGRNVARNGEQALGTTIRVEDGADGDIPPAQVPPGGRRSAAEPARSPFGRFGNGFCNLGPLLFGPGFFPVLAQQRVEVVDLHYLRAALTHELERPVQRQDLDAIGRALEDPAVELLAGAERIVRAAPLGGVAVYHRQALADGNGARFDQGRMVVGPDLVMLGRDGFPALHRLLEQSAERTVFKLGCKLPDRLAD